MESTIFLISPFVSVTRIIHHRAQCTITVYVELLVNGLQVINKHEDYVKVFKVAISSSSVINFGISQGRALC